MKKIIIPVLALLPMYVAGQGTWKNYTKSNSAIPSNKVYALGIDFGGKPWTGTNSGISSGTGLAYYSGAYFQPVGRPGTGLIYDIMEHGGLSWVLTGDSLVAFGESPYTIASYAPDASLGITSMAYANPLVRTTNNFFWLKPDGYMGLLVFDPSHTITPPNRWRIFNKSNSTLPTDSIVHISARWGTADNFVYAATKDKGLVKFNGVSSTSFNTGNSSIPSNSINLVEIDMFGNVWMIIGDDKLVKFDGTSIFTTYTSDSLQFASVIRSDADSALWIGSPSGLIKFKNGAFTVFNTSNSPLTDNDVLNIQIDANQNIWVGTFTGGLNVYNESGTITLGLDNKKSPLLSLYPNPADDHVEISSPEALLEVKVFDMQGREVKVEITGNTIDIKHLQPGVYVVDAKTVNHVLKTKLVKK